MATATGPVDHTRQREMIIVSSVMASFGALAMLLRIIGRYLIVRKIGTDDWFMVIGTLFSFGYLFELLYGTRFGMGLEAKHDSLEDMVVLLKIVYSIKLTYNAAITAIKFSIIFFYLRPATANRKLRIAC